MSKKPKNDVVWYWVGGAETGEWRQANYGTRALLRRAGFVAHDGSLAIGAPEGPPREDVPAGPGHLTAIEHLHFAAGRHEAREGLEALAHLDGYLGGRVLSQGPGKPWRAQAFFEAEDRLVGPVPGTTLYVRILPCNFIAQLEVPQK